MDFDKLSNKLKRYINNYNFNINDSTLEYITNKFISDKNIYSRNKSMSGGIGGDGPQNLYPSEYYGLNSGEFTGDGKGSPSFSPITTRPALLSTIFPLKGGYDGGCSTCSQSGGCGCAMKGGCPACKKKRGGCKCGKRGGSDGGMSGGMIPVYLPLFVQKDIKELNKNNFIRVTNKDYKSATKEINSHLTNILHATFYNVKNKNNLVGKVHFQKVIKKL